MKKLLTYTALATLSLSTITYGATCPDPSYLEISDNGTVSFSEEYQYPDYWYIQQVNLPDDVSGFRFYRGVWSNSYETNNVSCNYNNENGINDSMVYLVGIKNVSKPKSPNWIITSEIGANLKIECYMDNVKQCPFLYGEVI